MVNSRRGRPRHDSDTPRRILDAAASLFSASGYSATTIRAVARSADVDHALVHYYFGTKEELFRRAMSLPGTPVQALAAAIGHAPDARLGSAILASALAMWEMPGSAQRLKGVVQESSAGDTMGAITKDYLEQALITRLAEALGGRDAEQRAGAACALVAGVFFSRYILEVEPLASLEPETIVHFVGPAIDFILYPRDTSSSGSIQSLGASSRVNRSGGLGFKVASR